MMGGRVCQVEKLTMDSRVTARGGKTPRDGVGPPHTQWSDDTVNNQWRGKDTISAGEQHTSPDHLGHYAAHWPHIHCRWRFMDDGGRWTCKWKGERTNITKNERDANRMTEAWWWVGNENGERAASAGYKRKERSGWSENWHVGENLQPIAARKLQMRHCPEARHIMMYSRRKLTREYPTDCTARSTNTLQRLLVLRMWRSINKTQGYSPFPGRGFYGAPFPPVCSPQTICPLV